MPLNGCSVVVYLVTLTLELDLDNVRVSQRANYPGQRSVQKVIFRIQTHTDPIALSEPQ